MIVSLPPRRSDLSAQTGYSRPPLSTQTHGVLIYGHYELHLIRQAR